MAFLAKTDYFGIENSNISCVSTTEGRTFQTVQALDEVGDIIAMESFGDLIAPSNEYKICGTLSSLPSLGNITTVNGKKIMLGSVSIATSSGGEPTFGASGNEVESGATTGCHYDIPSFTLTPKRHTQNVFDSYTLEGSGCHATSNSYTITSNIGTSTKDGTVLASDVTEGKIECQLNIVQTGTTNPTVTPKSGWQITSPLTMTNSDSSYANYSVTLTKILDKTIG